MTRALERVSAFLFEAPAPAPTPTASLPPACRAAVLGAVPDVVTLAAALAITLRAADRRPAALVALWGAVPPGAGPAVPVATKLAAAVRSCAEASDDAGRSPPSGHARSSGGAGWSPPPGRTGSSPPPGGAAARGRLAWLALPAEPTEAVDTLVAAAAIVDAPLVTALAGARPAALDALVAGHDLVVAAAAPGTLLAEAAIERLAAQGVSAVACRPPGRGLGRFLALAGWAAPRLELAPRVP